MIILIKNNKDAFEACLNAMNRMLLPQQGSSDAIGMFSPMHLDISKKGQYEKKIIRYRTLLAVFRLSRFMRFNILAPFCSAASTLASSEETKKDKFLFGVKMFGLVLLSALILPVALVSHPITHSIGRIVSKIRGNKDGKVPPEDITFAGFLYETRPLFKSYGEVAMNTDGANVKLVTLDDVMPYCENKYSSNYKHPIIEDEISNGEVTTKITRATANPCGKIDQVMAFGGVYR